MKVNMRSLSYYYQRQKSTVELEDGLSQHSRKDSPLFYTGFIHWISNLFLCSFQSKLLYTLKLSFQIFVLEKYSVSFDCCIMHHYALSPRAEGSLKSLFIAFTISFVELEKDYFFLMVESSSLACLIFLCFSCISKEKKLCKCFKKRQTSSNKTKQNKQKTNIGL